MEVFKLLLAQRIPQLHIGPQQTKEKDGDLPESMAIDVHRIADPVWKKRQTVAASLVLQRQEGNWNCAFVDQKCLVLGGRWLDQEVGEGLIG